MNGQFLAGGICIDCKTPLDVLHNKGSCGYVRCSKCDKGYDAVEYYNAGGRFYNNDTCYCTFCKDDGKTTKTIILTKAEIEMCLTIMYRCIRNHTITGFEYDYKLPDEIVREITDCMYINLGVIE